MEVTFNFMQNIHKISCKGKTVNLLGYGLNCILIEGIQQQIK